jgi:hypothetical protein
MYWADCSFDPGPAWEQFRPMFDAQNEAWQSRDRDAQSRALEAIGASGLTVVPCQDEKLITEFVLLIDGQDAAFRYPMGLPDQPGA